jgi:hypothetical protein
MAFNGLRSIISQKIELFITIAVGTSNSTSKTLFADKTDARRAMLKIYFTM